MLSQTGHCLNVYNVICSYIIILFEFATRRTREDVLYYGIFSQAAFSLPGVQPDRSG
jgi:hypothetical protein